MPKSTPKITIPSRYSPTKKHFHGGFGDVLVLHDDLLNREVALKMVRSDGDKEQLRNEINAISEVRSKHVVRIYDLVFGDDGNVQGIIEEYLPGDDLTAFCTAEQYTPARFLRTAYQIASGISDVHERGLVHRDVKLENMKADAESIIKLFDFGLSCNALDHETVISRASYVYAGPEWYSPPFVVDKPVDVYAFGICCWLLVSQVNRLPMGVLEKPPQSTQDVPSISSVATGLSGNLITLIDATLNKDTAQRPEMATIRDEIARQLVYGKHRAWLTGGHVLNTPGQTVLVGNDSVGKITVGYDGSRFLVLAVTGDAYVNNRSLNVGDELPASSVITIGADSMGGYRKFVEFNVSHPEVVL